MIISSSPVDKYIFLLFHLFAYFFPQKTDISSNKPAHSLYL